MTARIGVGGLRHLKAIHSILWDFQKIGRSGKGTLGMSSKVKVFREQKRVHLIEMQSNLPSSGKDASVTNFLHNTLSIFPHSKHLAHLTTKQENLSKCLSVVDDFISARVRLPSLSTNVWLWKTLEQTLASYFPFSIDREVSLTTLEEGLASVSLPPPIMVHATRCLAMPQHSGAKSHIFDLDSFLSFLVS